MGQMTRAEHMRWCKHRALEYLDQEVPDVASAIASMLSDLRKHPETEQLTNALGPLGLHSAMNNDSDAARRFIEGFAE